MRKIRLLYRLAAIDDHGTADDEASRIRTLPHDRSGKSGNEHPGRQLESLLFRHGKPAKFPCAKINSAVISFSRWESLEEEGLRMS